MSIPVVIVVASGTNRVIGVANGLPWHLSSDLKRFKALTMGAPMIMGRKTFESIGKALPGRETIVVTRRTDASFGDGVHVARTLEEALRIGQERAVHMGAAAVTVVGGADIYGQALPHADRLEITEVEAAPEGDASFPTLDPEAWIEITRERHEAGVKDDHAFSFVTLTRR